MIPRSAVHVFCLLLVLSEAALAQSNRFRQISAWVSEARFTEDSGGGPESEDPGR